MGGRLERRGKQQPQGKGEQNRWRRKLTSAWGGRIERRGKTTASR